MSRKYYSVSKSTNIEELLENVKTYSEEQIEHVFVFSDFDFDDMKSKIDIIIDFEKEWIEQENADLSIPAISLKNISKENKIKCLLYAMENSDMVDQWMLLNIYNIIKGYNTFSDGYFASEEIYFSDLVELMDILPEIKSDKRYEAFIDNLAKYYLSIIKSVGIMSGRKLENAINIPLLYQRILFVSDFISLSNILNKSNNISTEDLPVINGSYMYLAHIAGKFITSNSFMEE